MKGWYFSTTSNCEQKRDGELWTHSYGGKCAMIDSHAVKKEIKSHLPPGRNACVLKDLEQRMVLFISKICEAIGGKYRGRKAATKLQFQQALHHMDNNL